MSRWLITMEDIKWVQMDSQNPDVEAAFRQAADEREPKDITQMRNADGGVPVSYLEADPTLNDYYTTTGKHEVLELDRQEAREKLESLALGAGTSARSSFLPRAPLPTV